MILRPIDASGDILPVLHRTDLLSGGEAVAVLVRERLNLLAGEWWENPARGCRILEMICTGRVTEQDVSALTSYLSSYIAATPGVRSVENVQTAIIGRQLAYSCRVVTDYGSEDVSYTVNI